MTILTDYEAIVNIFDVVVTFGVLFFTIFSLYYVIFFFNSFRKPKVLPKGEIFYKYAILVPARNEDKVIRHVLTALKNQDYPADKFDVFVIIESKDDPTYNITKKFGYTPIIRK